VQPDAAADRDTAAPDDQRPTGDRPEGAKLDQERLRRLLGDPPAQELPADNPLHSAIRGMRSAHERIAARDTSAETRAIQQQVVDDLAKLIDLARQSPPPPENPPSQSPEQQPQSEPESESDSQPSAADREQQAASPQQQQQQQQQSERARESADRAREAESRAAELRRRQNLVDGVWGHLPPAVRNKILSGTGDEYLHDYEHLARRYFEALAEEGARER
jgi:hypothetical protein